MQVILYTKHKHLSIESERIRIAEELKANHGDVNVVINNAGAAFAYSLSSGTNAYENASREMETNYLGIIHFTELMLPLLMKKDSAAIINVTSIVGLVPAAGVPTYSASKAALRAYTQSLRTSLGNTSVKVFELLPPLVNTEFSAPIGGANGIPPRDVATELMAAIESDRFEVPVGQTKIVHSAIHGALSTLNA